MDNKHCGRLLLELALGDMNNKNYGMAEAMTAMGDDGICGALAAAAAVLYSKKEIGDAEVCHDELMDWFESSFGGYDCESVAGGIGALRDAICPKLILMTYLRLRTYTHPDNSLSQKALI
ncbi:MAG: hypothetical protein LBG82_05395 [Clostridiales Family XIII bacterium]|jgi:hypothetical protein|nr:hypothetical protein [Clostridiales Family XIII bacterium]